LETFFIILNLHHHHKVHRITPICLSPNPLGAAGLSTFLPVVQDPFAPLVYITVPTFTFYLSSFCVCAVVFSSTDNI
jgi:hypothetical protein